MVLTVLQLFFFVTSIHGMSLEGALNISKCLESCEDNACFEKCNQAVGPLDSNFPKVNEVANAHVDIHCRTSNVLIIKHNPGTYIIEQSTSVDKWEKINVSNGNFTTFDNLTASRAYRFRLYRLTIEGISEPEISNWFTTYAEDYRPKETLNASVDDFLPFDQYGYPLLVQIKFEPAEDRACDYQVRTWDGELDLYHFSVMQVLNFSFFTLAQYEKSYDVLIFAQNGDKVGKETRLNFSTPSCYEVHNRNLNVCAPMPVEKLQVRDVQTYGSACDLMLTWQEPMIMPQNYTIMIYLLQTSEFSDKLQYANYELLHQKTIPGNATTAFIPNIKLEVPYKVDIYAASEGGTSATTTVIKNQFDQVAEPSKTFEKLINISSVIAMTIILIGLLCAYMWKGKNKGFITPYTSCRIKSQEINSNENNGGEIFTPQDKFELCPNRLKLSRIVGTGAYGVVKLGTLIDDTGKFIDVAVKTVKENLRAEDVQNLYREIEIMKCAGRHTNIVSLIGYCRMGEEPALIMEYCSTGNLQSYLRKIWESVTNVISDFQHRFTFDRRPSADSMTSYVNVPSQESDEIVGNISNCLYDMQQDLLESVDTITSGDLFNFARQIAVGMEYLASKRIVHRDLAARNVLVCSGKVVKISDFGLSRDVYQEDMYKKQGNHKLPIKWLAIESLTHQIYTTQSDVWSYGILLWEIVMLGGTPYPEVPTNDVFNLLTSGYRMEKPSNCSEEVYNLMLSCWDVNPRCRPTFAELKNRVDIFLCEYFGTEYMTVIDEQSVPTEHEQLISDN